MRTAFGTWLAGAALVLSPHLASPAAAFPDKPVQVVVPYGAGGSSDIVARTIVSAINDMALLSHPMVVINVNAGAGAVGFQRVKDAEADGYEILVSHIGLLVSGAIGRTDFGPEAYDAIAETGSINIVSATKSDSRFDNFEDFVSAAKESAGGIAEASSIGGSVHLASLLLSTAAGYDVRIVHTGGGANRLQSLLGGHTRHTFFSTAEYLNFRESGVRALAILAPERHPDLPDLPTVRELGYDVSFRISYWWFAPNDTPEDRMAVLADAFETALADTDLQQTLRDRGLVPGFRRGDGLDASIEAIYADVKSYGSQLSPN